MSDCVPVMKEMAEKGELFDYIIYDITDVPVSPTPTGEEVLECINHVIPQMVYGKQSMIC